MALLKIGVCSVTLYPLDSKIIVRSCPICGEEIEFFDMRIN